MGEARERGEIMKQRTTQQIKGSIALIVAGMSAITIIIQLAPACMPNAIDHQQSVNVYASNSIDNYIWLPQG